MSNNQLLGDIPDANLLDILTTQSKTPSEHEASAGILAILQQCPIDDFEGLYKRVLKEAGAVKPRLRRENFVGRIVATLNDKFETRFLQPPRTFPQTIKSLAPTDPTIASCASLVPRLLHRTKPGLLRLTLLFTHKIGMKQRTVFRCLARKDWDLFSEDQGLNIPISDSDYQHSHIIWLPEPLQQDIESCWIALKAQQPMSKAQAQQILKKELNEQLKPIIEKGISPHDRSEGAAQLRSALSVGNFNLSTVTISKLLEASYVYGAAAHMPRDLLHMLEQKTLPASAKRIRLYSPSQRALPASPNQYTQKPDLPTTLSPEVAKWENDRVEYFSEFDILSEDTWLANRRTCLACRDLIIDGKPASVVGNTLLSTGKIYHNSYWAWVVKFLFVGSARRGSKWVDSTYREYFSLLLPTELMTIPAIADVEEFDREDLIELFAQIDHQNTEKKAARQKKLICRMIRFAQDHSPDLAFPEISRLDDDAESTLNKREHILTPGELEQIIDRAYSSGCYSEVVTLTLAGFMGLRPFEIIYLRKKDITRFGNTAEFNIALSKTRAGKRCVPAQGLVPSSLLPKFLKALDTLLGLPGNEDLFYTLSSARHRKRIRIIQPAIDLLRSYMGDGIDMYTLRHGFASWCYIRASKLRFDSPVWNKSPTLQHELFNADLEAFSKLCFYEPPAAGNDPEVFYRICRFMGHATPFTLARTYCHSAGIVHSAFLSKAANIQPKSHCLQASQPTGSSAMALSP